MNKFTIYHGKFICHHCKTTVEKARFWRESYDLTWMCSNNHISKVNLYVRGY